MSTHIKGDISTLNGSSLKLVDKFTYLGSSVPSTENDINTWLAKTWTAIDCLMVIWKSDLTDKIKRSFFQAVVVSILLYRCTTRTLTKEFGEKPWRQLQKNTASNIEQVLEATPHKAAAIRPLTSHHENCQVRRTRHARHCRRSRDELISDILLWTPSHGRAKWGRPARTYLQHLCADTGCSLEDLPEVMNEREGWRERVKGIRTGNVTCWRTEDLKLFSLN